MEKVSFEKLLYAIFFEKKTGKILLINLDDWFVLPGGEVLREDICEFIDERWKRGFLCKKVPNQTGITAYFIEEKVQPIPATYEVYYPTLREEFSAIIIGEIDSYLVNKDNTKFYNVDEFKELVKRGRVSRSQELLILRAFVSRDCHNKKFNDAAVPLLKEKHK
jgi:hypothetical protein